MDKQLTTTKKLISVLLAAVILMGSLHLTSPFGSRAGNAEDFTLKFSSDGTVFKTVRVDVDGSGQTLIPHEAVPTDKEIAAALGEGSTLEGWVDPHGEALRLREDDGKESNTKKPVPTKELEKVVMSGDLTLDAFTTADEAAADASETPESADGDAAGNKDPPSQETATTDGDGKSDAESKPDSGDSDDKSAGAEEQGTEDEASKDSAAKENNEGEADKAEKSEPAQNEGGDFVDSQDSNQNPQPTPAGIDQPSNDKKTRGVTPRAAGDEYLIQFTDSAGQIIHSLVVKEGFPIYGTPEILSGSKTIPPQGYHFSYWYDATDSSQSPKIFDGGVKAWSDMKFMPKFEKVWHVIFVAEENKVTSAAVEDGRAVAGDKPIYPTRDGNPARKGYTFSHWSLTKDGPAFDVDRTPIRANTVLHAVWNPAETTYEIRCWVEKPNLFPSGSNWDKNIHDNYKFLNVTTAVGFTGMPVTSRASGSEGGAMINAGLNKETEVKAPRVSLYEENTNYAEFHHTSVSTNDGRIAGNGTTVVNVYFTRIEFSIEFSLNGPNNKRWYSTMEFPASNGGPYKQNSSVIPPLGPILPRTCGYKMTAKYEEDITKKFPCPKNGMSVTYGSNRFGDKNRWIAWVPYIKSGGSDSQRALYNNSPPYFDNSLVVMAKINNGFFESASTSSQQTIRVNSWLETSLEKWNQTSGSKTTRNGKYYVLSTDHSSDMAMPTYTNLIARTHEGYDLDESSPRLQRGPGYFYIPTPNANESCDFYYNRHLYNLSLDVEPVSTDGQGKMVVPSIPNYSRTVLFEEPITRWDAPQLQYKIYNNIRYDFRGWYYDKEYINEFHEDDLMPAHNVILYAKWQSQQFTVSFYDFANDAHPITSSGIGLNEYIPPASIPPYKVGTSYDGKGVFEGWRREVKPHVFIDFDTAQIPISEDTKLVAQWRYGGYKITYIPGNGSGSDWVDPEEYSIDKKTKSRAKYPDHSEPGTPATGTPGPHFTAPTGLVFVGWRPEDRSGNPLFGGGFIGQWDIFDVKDDMVMRATYVPKSITATLTFHRNDMPNSDTEKVTWTRQVGQVFNLAQEGMFTRQGYTQLGWGVDRTTTPPYYQCGQGNYTMVSGDTHLYAIWKKNTTESIDPGKITKTANKSVVFKNGEIIWYTIRFELPQDISNFEHVVIKDRLPNTLEFLGNVVIRFGNGNGFFDSNYLTVKPGVSGMGEEISYKLTNNVLNSNGGNGGEIVEMRFAAKVQNWTMPTEGAIKLDPKAGEIENICDIYVKPMGEAESKQGDAKVTVKAPPVITDVTKASSQPAFYNNGDKIKYTVKFKLPDDVTSYGAIRIEDKLPQPGLKYVGGSIEVKVDDAPIVINSSNLSTAGGKVSYKLDRYNFEAKGGKYVAMTFTAIVDGWTAGSIKNDAKIFMTPRNDNTELPDPVGEADRTIDPLPNVDCFIKEAAQNKFYTNGDEIVYRISFRLPPNISSYAAINIVDKLPQPGMKYKDNSVNVIVGGNPIALDTARLVTTGGIVSYKLIPSEFPNPSEEVHMILTGIVDGWPGGNVKLTNKGQIFVTPKGGQDPDPNTDNPAEEKEKTIEPLPRVEDFSKTASQKKFTKNGDEISYTIKFRLPSDVTSYAAIRIEDKLPQPGMKYKDGTVEVKVSGTAINPLDSARLVTTGGIVSYQLEKADFAGYGGQIVTMTLTGIVDGWTGGDIENHGYLYVKPEGGRDPSNPSEDKKEKITPLPPVTDIVKTATPETFYTNGNKINYTVKFKLPKDVTGYGAVRIEDKLPQPGLKYVDNTVEVKVSGTAITLDHTRLVTTGGIVSYNLLPYEFDKFGGQEVSMTLTASVDGWVSGSITNKAEVFVTPKDGIGGGNPGGAGGGREIPMGEAEKTVDPLEKITGFTKEASQKTFYGNGDEIGYKISFKLPMNVSSYGAIIIVDDMPSTLKYVSGSAVVTVGGVRINPLNAARLVVSGSSVSYKLTEAEFANKGNALVEMYLVAKVGGWKPSYGNIKNDAKLYVVPKGGNDPDPGKDKPDLEKPEEITPIPHVEDFRKDASQKTFSKNGDEIDYTIGFKLPLNITSYAAIRIEDKLPQPGMKYKDGSLVVRVSGTAITLDARRLVTTGGVVSYKLEENDIAGMGGQEVTMTLTGIVDGWSGGDIENYGHLYVTPKDGKDPTDPNEKNTEEITTVPPVTDFKKEASQHTFYKNGDKISYTIKFSMPSNIASYSAIKIVDDMRNSALKYVGGSVKVTVDGKEISPLDAARLTTTGGIVSYKLLPDEFKNSENKEIAMTLTAVVNGWTGGNISNDAKLYVTPVNGSEPDPDKPNEKATEEITPLPPITGFTKDASQKTFYKDGDKIGYTLKFTLPASVASYGAITIVDNMPSQLKYVSGSAVVTVGGVRINPLDAARFVVSGGSVSYKLIDAEFAGKNNAVVEMYLVAEVKGWKQGDGNIKNDAKLYVTPKDGKDPDPNTDKPDVGVTEEITPLPPVTDFKKDASQKTFQKNGDEVDYTISFDLPRNVASYAAINIVDRLPKSGMKYKDGSLKVSVSGTAISPLDSARLVTTGGVVSYKLDKNDFMAFGGQKVVMTLTAIVDGWTGGNLKNDAELYVTPDGAKDPEPGKDKPDVETHENITPLPPVTNFKKESSQDRFYGNGDKIGYTIKFKLPKDITSYAAIRIVDEMPHGLAYVDGTVVVSVSGTAIRPLDSARLVTTGGVVSYKLEKADFAGMGGQEITMTLTAIVKGWNVTDGNIKNFAKLYVTPMGATDPVPGQDKPDYETSKEITPLPHVEDFRKDSSQATFQKNGDEINYTIRFKLPKDVASYAAIRIVDELPQPGLKYKDGTVKVSVSGTAINPLDTARLVTTGGIVSYKLEKADFAGYGGQEITMTLTGIVDGWTSGNIKNKAKLYVTPEGGKDPADPADPSDPNGPTDPSEETSNEITPIPPVTGFKKEASQDKFYGNGDRIDYTVRFTLPKGVASYAAIRIVDELPQPGLKYVDGSVKVNVGGTPVTLEAARLSTAGGIVSYKLLYADFKDAGEKEVTMTLTAEVNGWKQGDGKIKNDAKLYITPAGENEPAKPSEEGHKEITPLPPVTDFKKDASQKTFNKNGDEIRYTLSFKLPQDVASYAAIRIEDKLPQPGLKYKDNSVEVKVSGTAISPLDTARLVTTGGIVSYKLEKADFAGYGGQIVTMTLTGIVDGWTSGNIKNKAKLYVTPEGGQEPTDPKDPSTGTENEITPVPPVTGFKKEASQKTFYKNGDKINYTIKFTLPKGVASYAAIRIEDKLPQTGMRYVDNTVEVKVSGTAITLDHTRLVTTGGIVSYKLLPYEFDKFGEKEVSMTLTAEVHGWTGGNLKNFANIYITPNDGSQNPTEPKDPTETVTEEIVPIPPVTDFKKDASQKTFQKDGDEVDYTIKFTLPQNVASYAAIRIEDELPATLKYKDGTVEVKVSGTAISPLDSARLVTTGGVVSYKLEKNDFAGYGGQEVSMTLTAIVQNWKGGNIKNKGNIYITPDGGQNPGGQTDPKDPTDTVTEEITPLPPVTGFAKEASQKTFYGNGDKIGYTIRFKLPKDITSYAAIRIVDELPNGMKYDDGSLKVSVSGTAISPLDSARLVTTGGIVSYKLEKADFAGMGGQEITMTLTAIVKGWTGGNLKNDAKLYITPVGEDEPTKPNGKTQEEITPIPPVTSFTKDSSQKTFYKNGDEIDYT
ncbi:MAG: isopeptide-forming domain-containing fimbrial protein, partial [Clostridiales Family XIII bacterium]|nr:isopeptide-forming domain-containing fimbrial protein [Clostridiales Family XIII bacterium]